MQEVRPALDGSLVQDILEAFHYATDIFSQLHSEEQLLVPGNKKQLQFLAMYYSKLLYGLSSHHPDINPDVKQTTEKWLFQPRGNNIDFLKGREIINRYVSELFNKGVIKY